MFTYPRIEIMLAAIVSIYDQLSEPGPFSIQIQLAI